MIHMVFNLGNSPVKQLLGALSHRKFLRAASNLGKGPAYDVRRKGPVVSTT